MSAAALALATRAADAYARVRGPWPQRPTTFVVERDHLSRRLSVRVFNPAWHKNAVLFDPLPRKEMPMPAPLPPMDTDETNIAAAGALCGILLAALVVAGPVVIDGLPTNALVVRFAGLGTFRVTVERSQ